MVQILGIDLPNIRDLNPHELKHQLINELPEDERQAALIADQAQHDACCSSSLEDFESDFRNDVLDPVGEEFQNLADEAQEGAEAIVEEIGRIPKNLQKLGDTIQGLFEGAFSFLKGLGKFVIGLIIGIPILIVLIIVLVLVRAARAARGKSAA